MNQENQKVKESHKYPNYDEINGIQGSSHADLKTEEFLQQGKSISFSSLIDFCSFKDSLPTGANRAVLRLPDSFLPSKGFLTGLALHHVTSCGTTLNVRVVKKGSGHSHAWKDIKFHQVKSYLLGVDKFTCCEGFAQIPAVVSVERTFEGPILPVDEVGNILRILESYPNSNIFADNSQNIFYDGGGKNKTFRFLKFSELANKISNPEKDDHEKLNDLLRSEETNDLLMKFVNYTLKKDPKYKELDLKIKSEAKDAEEAAELFRTKLSEEAQRLLNEHFHIQHPSLPFSDITISPAFEDLLVQSFQRAEDYRNVMLEKEEQMALIIETFDEKPFRDDQEFQALFIVNFLASTF